MASRRGPGPARLTVFCLVLLCALPAAAGEPAAVPLRLAVASSVRAVAEQLVDAWHTAGGAPVSISSAASGVLYAQIAAGAPFDLFLAADDHYPASLEAAGLARPGSRASYAAGRLVLLCDAPCAGLDVDAIEQRLLAARRIAVANPDTAPFGAVALSFLDQRGLRPALSDRLVRGNNAAQAYQFYHSGHADHAFVAGAQALAAGDRAWDATGYLDRPIDQQMLVLAASGQPQQAAAFADFVLGQRGRSLLAAGGYLPALTANAGSDPDSRAYSLQ